MAGETLSLLAGGLILLAGLASCDLPSSTAEDVNSQLTIESPEDWQDARTAIQKAGQNRTYFFTIVGNIPVPASSRSMPTFGHVEGLAVIFQGTGKLFLEGPGNLLYIDNGQTMTIDGPTLEGLQADASDPASENNTTSVIFVASGGKLEMASGRIMDNTVTAPQHIRYGGGGVSVLGSFIMNGGTISGNKVVYGNGGGVSVSDTGSFIMKGGTISGNKASAGTGNGGGVSVAEDGSFTMTGGTIKGNTAAYRGGGVYISGATASFQKNGGTLYGADSNLNNQNVTSDLTAGYAAFYDRDNGFSINTRYYCSNTLNERSGGGIDASGNLPEKAGDSRGNWTKL